MQHFIVLLSKNWTVLITPALAILGILLTITYVELYKEKHINSELTEYLKCRAEMLAEFIKIRHEYNNLLQTITVLIEDEDLEGLKEYKSKLLEKTHLINKNSLLQLLKIKDRGILKTVYEQFIQAREAGVAINLTVYNDIIVRSSSSSKRYTVLQDYLRQAYEFAVREAAEINLKVSANELGLCFRFESPYCVKAGALNVKSINIKKSPKTGKDTFFNTFLQNDQLIQEILVSFKN